MRADRSRMESLPTRRMVDSLSKHLPAAHRLTEPQADALLDVLADQRGIYIQ